MTDKPEIITRPPDRHMCTSHISTRRKIIGWILVSPIPVSITWAIYGAWGWHGLLYVALFAGVVAMVVTGILLLSGCEKSDF